MAVCGRVWQRGHVDREVTAAVSAAAGITWTSLLEHSQQWLPLMGTVESGLNDMAPASTCQHEARLMGEEPATRAQQQRV